MNGVKFLLRNGSRNLSKWKRTKSSSIKKILQLQQFKCHQTVLLKEILQPDLQKKKLQPQIVKKHLKRKSKHNLSVTTSTSWLQKLSSTIWVLKKKKPISKLELMNSDKSKILLSSELYKEKQQSNFLNWGLTIKTLWKLAWKLQPKKNTSNTIAVNWPIQFLKFNKILIPKIFLTVIRKLFLKERFSLKTGQKKWKIKSLLEQSRWKTQKQKRLLKDKCN